jgi:hypothetical protein
MQNHQGYPLMASDLVYKTSFLMSSPKNRLQLLVEVMVTPLYSLPSFAQRSLIHQSMQYHQSYSWMNSNLAGKPSLLLRSLKTPKPLIEVIIKALYSHRSFAQGSPTQQSMQNHHSYPLMTSNLAGKPFLLLRSRKNCQNA